jgi:capsid protein
MPYQSHDYEFVPARFMYHVQTPLLPQQVRGLSWLAQSLNGMGRVRDYCLAVLGNAEICANFALIFQTELGYLMEKGDQNTLDTDNVLKGERGLWEAFRTVMAPKGGAAMFAPAGATVQQLDPKQPASTYKEFKDTHVQEFGASIDVPYGLASGTHEDYNYASGRLDGQMFELKTKVLQEGTWEEYVLDPFFQLWYQLGLPYLIKNYEGNIKDVITMEEIEDRRQHGLGLDEKNIDLYQWKWKSPTHVDPAKVAQADALNLANSIETRENIIERNGGDAEDYAEQIKREAEMFPPLPSTGQNGNDKDAGGSGKKTATKKSGGDDDD